MDDLIEEVLDLWFEGVVENEMREAWWVQDEAFDAEIRRWFRKSNAVRRLVSWMFGRKHPRDQLLRS